jgi:hypothetical protein
MHTSNHPGPGSQRKKFFPLSPHQFQKWDLFVEKHPKGTIYHLSEWKKVLEESFRHIRGQIIAIWDERANEIVGGLPVYCVNSIITGKRLVSAPFANFCDPLVSNSGDADGLSKYLIEIYNQKYHSYIEIKARQDYNFLKDAEFKASAQYLHHFIPLEFSPEVLFNKFHKKAVRASILKSLKNNLKLKSAESEYELSLFYQIYLNARKRIGLPVIPYKYFLKLWEVFYPSKRLELILCMADGIVIGGSVLLKFKEWVFIEFGNDLFEFRKLCVNHFLDWSAIELAYQEGYKFLGFGRTSRNNKGLIAYKERWGTTAEDLLTHIYPEASCSNENDKEASWKYRIIKRICERSPSVFYKFISAVVYRHLG